MSAYKRSIVRVILLGLMITGAALLNSKPVEAAITCQNQCSINYSNCLHNCHGLGTCAAICGTVYQSCLKRCG